MAEIEIGPLTDRISDEEIAELAAAMEKHGLAQLPRGLDEEVDASAEDPIDDTVMAELLDRLDGQDAAAEIYLPLEFDGSFEVAGLRVSSTPLLLDVLDELKDELDSEEEDEEEDDGDLDDEDRRILARQLRSAWRLLYQSAKAAMERQLPLHIKT